MTNPEKNKSYREVRQESFTDLEGNTHTNVTRTSETVDDSAANAQSYQSGYVSGRKSERNYQQTLSQRDDENTNRGLLIGIVLAGIAALVGSAFWYFNQSNQSVDNTVTPTTSVPISTPSPLVIQTPGPQQTKIIEKTKEVPVTVEKTKEVPVTVEKTKEVPIFVPVPEQTTAPKPAVKNEKAPNANINVLPTQQPEVKQTPAPNNSTSKSNSSSSSNSTSSSTPTTSSSGDTTTSQNTPDTNTTNDK